MRPSLGLLDEGQRARLERARSRYGRKPVDADEEARFAIRYAHEHGEMPHQSDPDPRVRRCAFALLDNSECVGRVSPALREELAKARKDCGVYIYGDAGELVDDYVAFVEREGREPNPKAPALAERRLVHALRRQKDDLDEEQFRRVCQARETVRRRGQTSFSEKVLAEGLRASMDAGCFLGCNVTVGGRVRRTSSRRAGTGPGSACSTTAPCTAAPSARSGTARRTRRWRPAASRSCASGSRAARRTAPPRRRA